MGRQRPRRPSSSTIVPWPRPSAMVALPEADRSTKKVSVGSTLVSPSTVTPRVAVVVPGGKVSVPEVGR